MMKSSTQFSRNILIVSLLHFFFLMSTTGGLAKEANKEESSSPEAATIHKINIPVDELELLVKPLTKDELLIEADAWLGLLKTKVEEVSVAEIAIKQKNREIEKAKEVQKEIEVAKDALKEVKASAENTIKETTGEAAADTAAAAEKAQKAVGDVTKKIDDAIAVAKDVESDPAVMKALEATGVEKASNVTSEERVKILAAAKKAQTATEEVSAAAKEMQDASAGQDKEDIVQRAEKTAAAAATAEQTLTATDDSINEGLDKSKAAMVEDIAGADKLDKIKEETDNTAKVDAEIKTQILEAITDLRAERTALIDRLNVILDELNTKLGKTLDGKDNEAVVPYRLYAHSVGGLKVDVSDREAAWATVTGWLLSDEGGVRWAFNIAIFVITILVFVLLAGLFGKLAEKAFGIANSRSILLRNFVVHSVRRVTIIIGLMIGLAALEINIGPLVAIIGAAGFVVAFALQSTLSNFASGIMIMLYRPFDVGNFVDVAGVIGVVRSMNLVTTTITTPDNQVMVVPNNSIWGNIIINITGSAQRRVDLVFGIGYGDNIAHAEKVLEELVKEHPLTLEYPETVIKVHELADSSVNFICRPWAKTEDYWTVYWDITRMVKERFDAEGISIPFPQRDVHMIQELPESTETV